MWLEITLAKSLKKYLRISSLLVMLEVYKKTKSFKGIFQEFCILRNTYRKFPRVSSPEYKLAQVLGYSVH